MRATLQGLDFHGFARERLIRLERESHLLDAAETQLYHTLARIDPAAFSPIPASADPKAKHRCHLAEAFCQHLGLDESTWKQRCLVSQGVRDALGILMRTAAGARSTLWIPGDVYPVYLELAGQAGADVQTYWARTGLDIDRLEHSRDWTVLVCDPLKPWGGTLGEDARDRLVDTAQRQNGTVLVDGAYMQGLDPAWQAHVENDDPVVLLLSLSKGWLLPYRAGVALAGDGFSKRWRGAFAANSCSQDGLRQAYCALVEHPDRPARVARATDVARGLMLEELKDRGVQLDDPGHGYLVACDHDVDALERKGILAVPASVYGCQQGGCVLSCLSWVRADS